MAREGAGGELALAFRGRTFVLSFNMTCIRIQDEVAKAIFLMAGLTGALLYHQRPEELEREDPVGAP